MYVANLAKLTDKTYEIKGRSSHKILIDDFAATKNR
jgi:hypothetical protein